MNSLQTLSFLRHVGPDKGDRWIVLRKATTAPSHGC